MGKFTSLVIVTMVACFCAALSMTAALKCFRCGKYTPDGTGSILPCYDYNDTDLRECRSKDRYCLKYLNKGIIVRDCVEECKSGAHDFSEFFCCQEDGCNASSSLKMQWTICLIFIMIILMHGMT